MPAEVGSQGGLLRPAFELAWVDAHERKHVSRAVPMAIAASSEALADAGLDPATMPIEEKRQIGVVLGTYSSIYVALPLTEWLDRRYFGGHGAMVRKGTVKKKVTAVV